MAQDPNQDPLQQNTSGISGLFNQMNEDGKPAIVVETTNRDGQPRVKFEMDQATAASIQNSIKNYQKTIDAMNTRANELKMREQRQNPLMQVLSSVSGNLAVADKRLPPFVQALGRSNLELNPSRDQLARERLGVQEQIGKMEEGKLIAQERLAALMEARNQRIAHEADVEEDKRKQIEDTRIRTTLTELTTRLKETGGKTISDNEFRNLLKAREIKDPNLVDAALAAYKETGSNIAAEKKRVEDQKAEEKKAVIKLHAEETRKTAEFKADLSFKNAMRKQDRSMVDKKAIIDYKEKLKHDDELSIVKKEHIDRLVDLRTTEKYADDLSKILSDPKLADNMGFFKAGRVAPIFAKDEDRVYVEGTLTREIPRILNLVSQRGGVSILRTAEGQRLLQQMSVRKEMTVGQARQLVQTIRDGISENRRSVVDAYPAAHLENREELMGADEEYARQISNKYDKKSSGGPSKTGYQQWLEEQEKKNAKQ